MLKQPTVEADDANLPQAGSAWPLTIIGSVTQKGPRGPSISSESEPHLLTLPELAHRCAQETDRFFLGERHDPRYGFELFRRAIVCRQDQAWDLIYRQYQPLVAGWVRRHPAWPGSEEEVQYFVNRAFDKLWSAVTPEKFGRFRDLKSLLRYLQMCVHSAIVDELRSAEQPTVDVDAELLDLTYSSEISSVARQAVTSVERDEFWQFIHSRLNDDKERLVVYGSFVLGLKPRELYADYQSTFENVTEIYRIKQNVIARLRRDSELKERTGEGVHARV